MTREEFIHTACALGVHAIGTPGDRAPFAKNLLATAEAVADELGLLTADGYHLEFGAKLAELEAARARIGELEESRAKAYDRIRLGELEAEKLPRPDVAVTTKAARR